MWGGVGEGGREGAADSPICKIKNPVRPCDDMT